MSDSIKIQLIETAVALTIFLILRIIIRKSIEKTIETSLIQKSRAKIINKIFQVILLTVFSTLILIVWGVDQSELLFFIGSILTVLGVALFAQWSMLSNITSGIILFFNHTVKLDDEIKVLDKDYDIEGRISDIGLFFVIIKTKEKEKISIPNNVFIQKMIQQKNHD